MSSIGTGYDLSNSVFSPDGRVFQVEYAAKAVENGGTTIGLRCKDGFVLAVEKIITSKLLVPNTNKRIQHVDKHVGIAYSGMNPDGRHVVSRARDEAANWRDQFGQPMPVDALASNVAAYIQAYTLYNSVRPFGVSTIIGGCDSKGPQLFMIEPNGQSWGYRGAATGRGRQAARSELEKLDFDALDPEFAVKEAARIIYLAHEDTKDKDFEIEITWASRSRTGGAHELVPDDLLETAKGYALDKLEGGEDEE